MQEYLGIILITIVGATLAGVLVILMSPDGARTCPNCHKVWARLDVDEEILGIFQKHVVRRRNRQGHEEIEIVPHEKVHCHHQCKYCDHRWSSTRTRRL